MAADPNVARWAPLVRKVIKHQHGQISPAMLLSLIQHESRGDPHAVNSSSGAFGLTQFLPSTARSYGVKPGDPRSQIRGAVKYLNQLGYANNPTEALDHHYGGAGADGYHAALVGISKDYKFANKGSGANGAKGGSKTPGRSGSRSVTAKVQVPGVDNSALRQSYLLNYLSERGKPGALLGLAGELKSAKDVPAKTYSKTVKVPGQGGGNAAGTFGRVTPGSGGASTAVAWANHRKGIHETGANVGPHIDKWESKWGLHAQPWCGIFVGNALRKAGVKVGPGMPDTGQIANYIRSGTGGFRGAVGRPQVGDVAVWDPGPNGHTGLIVKTYHDGSFDTTEGNSSDRVQTVHHASATIIGRPNYPKRRR